MRVAALVVAAGVIAAPFASAQAPGAPGSFADLAARLSPAVVNISTKARVGGDALEMPQLPEGSPFNELFRDFFERNRRGPRTVSSLGSGFVISADGLVVTNNHVIERAEEITVNFANGDSYDAELLGADDKTDIALLRIESEKGDLPFVEFGDSDAIRVGDWVLAIGNPFGLGGSVSAGIVSARDRDINAGPYDSFIQTDAAINRGNSGGPLFDMDGRVVGVNTAIISPSGGSIGIGFSVPANIVHGVVAQLRDFGETRRGWLGVRIQIVTEDIAESLGLDRARGALVANVTEGGPAEAAGLEPGDVILRFNGEPVEAMRDLPRLVAAAPVGEAAEIEFWRRGETVTLSVDLGRLEEAELSGAAGQGGEGAPTSVLGMALEPLTPERRAELELAEDQAGVLVASVEAEGAAAAKGVRPGDVIVEAFQERVESPAEVEKLIDAARAQGRKSVLLLLHRDGELRFAALSLN